MNRPLGIILTLLLIYRAWSRKSLSPLGILAATVTAAIHVWHPWSVFFACLVVFFLGGTTVTKIKHDTKARLTLSSTGTSGGEGARTHVQVLANSIIATLFVLLHAIQLKRRQIQESAGFESCWQWGGGDLLVVGIVANYAAVAADTFSSELGILSRKRPRLITSATLREVPPGTNGGVTLVGLLAGLLGSFTIALTSVTLLPFCKSNNSSLRKVFGVGSAGAGGNVGTKEKVVWVIFVTIWGGLGSLLDSFLGGWLQASIVDVRTGKVVEGEGGRRVPVGATRFLRRHLKAHSSTADAAQDLHQAAEQIRQRNVGTKTVTTSQGGPGRASRHVESGLGLLDNNAVNFLMALIMSVGGMLVAAWYWKVPLHSILI